MVQQCATYGELKNVMLRDEEETLLRELDALDGRLATLSQRQAARTPPPGDTQQLPASAPETRVVGCRVSATRSVASEDVSTTDDADHQYPPSHARNLTPPCRINPFHVHVSRSRTSTGTPSRGAHSSERTPPRSTKQCASQRSSATCASSRVCHSVTTTSADDKAAAPRGASQSPARRRSTSKTIQSADRRTVVVQDEVTCAAARSSSSGATLSDAVRRDIGCASLSTSSREAGVQLVSARHCGTALNETAPNGMCDQRPNGCHSPVAHTGAACGGVSLSLGELDATTCSGVPKKKECRIPTTTEETSFAQRVDDDVDDFEDVERRVVEELREINNMSAPQLTVAEGGGRHWQQSAGIDSTALCVSAEDDVCAQSATGGGQSPAVIATPSLRPARILPPRRKPMPKKMSPTKKRACGARGLDESDYVEHTRALVPLNGTVNACKKQIMGRARRPKAAEAKQGAPTPAAKRPTVVLPSMTSWLPRFPSERISLTKAFADLKADIAACRSYDYRTPSSSPTSSNVRDKRRKFTPTNFLSEYDVPPTKKLAPPTAASFAVSSNSQPNHPEFCDTSDSLLHARSNSILPPPRPTSRPAPSPWLAEVPRPPPQEHPAPIRTSEGTQERARPARINTSDNACDAVQSQTICDYTWPHSPIESPIPSSRSLSPVARRTTAIRDSKHVCSAFILSEARTAIGTSQSEDVKHMALKHCDSVHLALADAPSEISQSYDDTSTATGTHGSSACAQRHGAEASGSSSSSCSSLSDSDTSSSCSSASSSPSSSSSSASSVSSADAERHDHCTLKHVAHVRG